MKQSLPIIALVAVFYAVAGGARGAGESETPSNELIALGRVLFFDPNLSVNRQQSCATCHDPEHGFADARDNHTKKAFSVGTNGRSLGTRNTPSIAYAALTPEFHRTEDGRYRGGQFLDGRAENLQTQALEPILNPLEMAMPNADALRNRLQENAVYRDMFEQIYGRNVFSTTETITAALGAAISAFERSPDFATFDSKYDRYLRGEYKMTVTEEMGRSLFFSPLTNCSTCHVLHTNGVEPQEPFTNFEFHNIGVPANPLRANDLEAADRGLQDNPLVQSDPAHLGKFRVPTLRNVAITAPYMHNGVFAELRTAIVFYNKYLVHSRVSNTNPETGLAWAAPEVSETVALDKLEQGQPMGDDRIDAIMAFLNTLTDARYEHLLPNQGAQH